MVRVFTAIFIVLAAVLGDAHCSAAETLADAEAARTRGKLREALRIIDKVLEGESGNTGDLLMYRGSLQSEMGDSQGAESDFTAAIKQEPDRVQAYYLRGRERYKLGQVEESIADFERVMELEPARRRRLWELGISYFEVGRNKEGQAMFEAYQTYDNADVENVVYRYLCMARDVGPAKAREEILPVGPDSRVPMREVYELYAGKTDPATVLRVAAEHSTEERREPLFYAHLYLGLYFDVNGDTERAREHLAKAIRDYPTRHYMGDVARVHLARMEADSKKDRPATGSQP
jgi:lipoprotein NlpI